MNASYDVQFQRERTLKGLYNPKWQGTGRAAFQFEGKPLMNFTLA